MGYTISARSREGRGHATHRDGATEALRAAVEFERAGSGEILINQDFGQTWTLAEFAQRVASELDEPSG